jgi:hypothetical protein
MAIQETRTLPAQFITDIGKDYATQLKGLTSIPLDTGKFAPQVAAQDPMQAQAYQLGQAGVGAYEPYITGAGAAGMAPGAAPMGAAAATTLGGVPSYLTQAGAYSGPTGYEDFMSPYQQDVINTTMADFDAQSAKGLAGLGQKAALSGQFLGGGREGVQRAEYQALSDRNRASMLAQLRQQGFGQAQGAAGQAYQQQMGLGQAQGALAQSQLGLGSYQAGLGSQVPQLQAGDIGQLGQLGAIQQAQEQAQLGATQEANRMTAMEPYERLGQYGTGVTGLIAGMPGQYGTTVMPNPTPLQTALGTGAVLGGIYGNIGGRQGSGGGYSAGSPAQVASQWMMQQPHSGIFG